ncbi:MAG: hypothetical protein PHE51_07520 [Eubacteriales bacterium]|nr:hypothetical protein [Eubacteriales bacterium]
MSELSFLFELKGQALEDAMSSGATYKEWDEIDDIENIDYDSESIKEQWEKLKLLRECKLITNEKFQSIKKAIFLREADNKDKDLLDSNDIAFTNLQHLKVQLDNGGLTQDEFNRKVKIFVHID